MKNKLKNNHYLKVIIISLIMASIILVPQIIKGKGILSVLSDFNYQQIPFSIEANNLIKTGNIQYEWNNDLGTSFIGSYSFYNLGSIFFLISLMFPSTVFPYLIGPLLILKYVVAALFAYIFLKRYVKNKDYAVIGALLYAFSGFQITNMLFNHFHDVVALFPLLLIGLDKAMLDNKKGLFAIAVAINAFTNYFFFIGQVVFLIIYFIVKIITKEYKLTIKKFITLAIESLLGVGIASILFIPSIIFVLDNPRVNSTWTLLTAFKPQVKVIAEILRGFIIAPEIMSQRGLFSEYQFASTEAYLPFVGIVLCSGYMWKHKKNWITILLLICFLLMLFPITNSLFFALNTAYYSRWFYMIILIIALASAKALEEKIKLEYGYLATTIIFSGLITAMLYLSLKGNQVVFHINYFLVNVLITLFGLVGLYIIYKLKDKKKLFVPLIVTGIVISTTLNGIHFFYKYNALNEETNYIDGYLKTDLKLDYLKDGERTNSTQQTFVNYSYILGIPNISSFNSTISGHAINFYNSLGLERGVRTIITDEKIQDFLSVKYIITDKNENLDYELKEETNYNKVYINKNYLSQGIPYKYYISKEEFLKLDNDTKKDILIYAVVLDEKQINKYSNILEKINLENIETLNKNYNKYIKELSNNTSKEFTYTENGAKLTIDSEKEKFIVLTIPYDKGWTITNNKQKITYENVDNGLIGITISEGKNNIEMTYKTPGLKLSLIISIISIISLSTYLLLIKTKRLVL